MLKALLVSAGLLLATAPAQARTQPSPAPQAQPAAASNVYVASYRRGPRYDPAKALFDQAGVKAHMDHIRSLGAAVVAAAPVTPSGDEQIGYVIFQAEDDAAAAAWLGADPALAAGSMTAKVHRWGVPRIKSWTRPPG